MPKNIFQDIKPIRHTANNNAVPFVLHKKQIFKDIKKDSKFLEENNEFVEETSDESRDKSGKDYKVVNQKILYEERGDNKGNNNSHYALWIIAVITLVFLVFAVSSLFTKARVAINPKVQDFTLNKNFSAIKDTNSSDVLSFNLISLSGEEEKVVNAGEEKEYLQKATGTIILYNNFSAAAQKISTGTRLEGLNGKIYKIASVTTIPGIKDNKPGSVEADIYASEPGEDYNTSPIDFKILSFKNTSKYEKFYGRSKGDITGGLVGKLRLVGAEDKAKAIEELKVVLKDKLFKKALGELPEGYILFKDAVVFRLDDENAGALVTTGQEEVPVKIKGTLYGFLFKENNLTKKIVETIIPKYDNSDVYIPNIKDFTVTMPTEDVILNFSDINNINFNLAGSSKIVWSSDEEKLKSSLADKPKKDFKHIISQYPNIDSADLIVHPVWIRDIPSDPKNIKIIVNSPE